MKASLSQEPPPVSEFKPKAIALPDKETKPPAQMMLAL